MAGWLSPGLRQHWRTVPPSTPKSNQTMCGIAGSFGRDNPEPERLRATLEALARRGPDGEGMHLGRLGKDTVRLLHRRLSIIDLDPRAGQPMNDGPLSVIHNGEIYNYVELRAELEGLGHVFRTTSDTEVLLKAYRQWGVDGIAHFEGMWAFVLFDAEAGRLILSRDRFGEKPLFWHFDGATLYFASETKALAALAGKRFEPDPDQIRRYLVNGFKSLHKQASSWYRGVEELPAGTTAVLTEPGVPSGVAYWELDFRPRKMNRETAVAETKTLVERALEIRLRSDVPLAFCLSGGIDSSALVSLAVKRFGRDVTAFSIVDSDPRYNESANIQATVADLGCKLVSVRTSTEGFLERMTDLVGYHDKPVATISYYVHSFLSEAIAAKGFKVALSGTGADELFTGYYDHYGFWLAGMRDQPDFAALVAEWQQSYGAHVENPLLKDPLTFARQPDARGHIYLDRARFNGCLVEPLDEDFFEAAYAGDPLRNRMLNELRHEIVPVILAEDDRNSMRCSIENRSPYLDRSLAEFAFTVPSEHLIGAGYPKYLLRAAMAGTLNDRVRLDRRKRGFNASINSLLDRKNKKVIGRLLAPGPIFDLVKRDEIATLLKEDASANSMSKFLFSFVSARLFLDQAAAA
ncbi:MAG: asparagine synthase (glutamine-hydrolyzing) [Alphaproteobacteria bacterium]|nr:asparagine synthase (glutamine-hydrolyzing) [Alphaproteobacteria bacterium]